MAWSLFLLYKKPTPEATERFLDFTQSSRCSCLVIDEQLINRYLCLLNFQFAQVDFLARGLPLAPEISNKLTGPFSLETRYPFSDRRLMEFCLALPVRQKLQHGWYRSIAHRVLSNLPHKVRWRSDKGTQPNNLTYSSQSLNVFFMSLCDN